MGKSIQHHQVTPVFPAVYFGSIGYFKTLSQFNKVELDGLETFTKQTFRNRFILNTANGIKPLSIPVVKPNGNSTTTEEVLLDDSENWRNEHWRTIKSAYASAPYFDFYGIEIEELLFDATTTLFNLNRKITERIIQWLELNVTILTSQEFSPFIENDFRITTANKKAFTEHQPCPYIQVFESNDYSEAISILDAILCIGPMARNLIIED